jgi:cysteine desulfurase/selenocysteine lyase
VRGATEGINLVAQSWGRQNVHQGDEIVITWLEHHANIVPWQMLCAEKGARLRVAPVDDTGQVILEEYEKLLNPKTRLVSVAQVSNALGTVTPLPEMIEAAHRLAHARRRPGFELRFLRAFRAQDVRAHRHRRGVRQV